MCLHSTVMAGEIFFNATARRGGNAQMISIIHALNPGDIFFVLMKRCFVVSSKCLQPWPQELRTTAIKLPSVYLSRKVTGTQVHTHIIDNSDLLWYKRHF